MPRPLGIARDGLASLYVVGITLDDAPSTMVRFTAEGRSQDAWAAGGIALTVSPAGDAAYVLPPSTETIIKYVIPVP
jgi:aspartate oxidase